MTMLDIAKITHEVNRAYCLSIGDDSHLPWDEAPVWQKESAIKGVEAHLNNPDISPACSHNLWLKVKQDEGCKYGPVKDVDKKEHPCFLPWYELPAEQKTKSYLFSAVVKELCMHL